VLLRMHLAMVTTFSGLIQQHVNRFDISIVLLKKKSHPVASGSSDAGVDVPDIVAFERSYLGGAVVGLNEHE